MKTSHTILLALLPARTSTSTAVLGERLRQSPKVLQAYLDDLETDGLVARQQIKSTVTVWTLTADGLAVIHTLMQPA